MTTTGQSVQETYDRLPAKGRPGMRASTGLFESRSYIVDSSGGVAFGRMVHQGAKEQTCDIGGEANTMLGISLIDVSRKAAQYDHEDIASIMVVGQCWVQVDGAVAVGGDVLADGTSGELGSTAGAGKVVVPGARWMTAASDNGIAIVRLTGAQMVGA